MNNIFEALINFDITIIFKAALIVLTFMYAIFCLVLFNHLRSLERIVIFKNSLSHNFVQLFGLIYLMASAILFLLSLVIL